MISGFKRTVLSEVLVVVRVKDGFVRVANRERPGCALAIDIVFSTAVHGEVRGLVNEGASLARKSDISLGRRTEERAWQRVPLRGAFQKAPQM